jgi:FkbM family methyltransferase
MKAHKLANKMLPAWLVHRIRVFVEGREFLWRNPTFSQFGEDAVLAKLFNERAWRKAAEAGVKDLEVIINGFYVDVGAYAPIQSSNTYLFHKRGWRGINIDPTHESIVLFKKMRPNDVNLELAIADKEGMASFTNHGLSVTNSLMGTGTVQVRTRRLESVLDEYCRQPINFMNVDAEGCNLVVLQSNNWQKYRPTFVLVESDDVMNNPLDKAIWKYMEDLGYGLVGLAGVTMIYEDQKK